ncbi:MAG: hypothetical protein JO153_15045 [Solirubrobacterales bacterium]|nr:hypothetical protein [Solirubrobacterales bacterium]MBV9334382.1 hypothetical protein [Solirubrobacterales bacterium]MBV9917821.1 hypothetical protein [Solirubrobacterales bacterium]
MPFFGHKSRREREWEEVRSSAQDDLVALGDDIRSLDVDVELPGVSDEVKQRYEQALQAYQRASETFDRARRPEDLASVSETLEEGRYAMAYTKALLVGKPPPERRAPCFFDPRHGPSTEDVQWAPPGGSLRPVPACAADAIRIREGFQPHGRQVTVDGRPTDYWNAPRHYGPWAGGYFNSFGGGGLLSTLLMGSALGAGLGLGAEAVGELFDGDGDGDGGGDGGWGDGDGGDFGGDGGDFGGGDW